MKVFKIIGNYIGVPYFRLLYHFCKIVLRYFPRKDKLGSFGLNSILEYPVFFDTPQNVYIDKDVIIRCTARFINSPSERIYVKQYTVIGPDCIIMTNSHQKCVGIPMFLSAPSNMRDKSADTTIGEDVWIGAKVSIMPGVNIGRGCIVGTGSLVTHSTPPYSVVMGSPARIVGKVFEKKDIVLHEEKIYDANNRIQTNELDRIFEEYHYDEIKTYGNNTPLNLEEQQVLEKYKLELNFTGIN
ncbi:MAG: acyltransferase [Bacteroidaceae bacterium]|nr:acyltransferase [Bacteroidaceae bacterium]